MQNTFILPRHCEKTGVLFRSRLVDQLAQALLDRDQYSHWFSSATAIQDAIYRIDSYYESNHALLFSHEQPLWESVQLKIRESNGCLSFSVWKDFSDLRRYGKVEARIHEFDLIDPREFGDIARLKTSDVRISRALIWSYLANPPQSVLNFWNTFDECGELIEDLADIHEDGRDWNFNFWLYSYMATGEVSRSHATTSRTLRQKLATLEGAYAKLPNAHRRRCAGPFHQTLTAGAKALRECGIVFDLLTGGRIIHFGDEKRVLEVAA